MGDERDEGDAERRARADVYSSAGIGAAAALTIVLVVLLVLDVAVIAYVGVEPLLVNGVLLKQVDGTVWQCAVVLNSSVPRCAEPRLLVKNSALEARPFVSGEGLHAVGRVYCAPAPWAASAHGRRNEDSEELRAGIPEWRVPNTDQRRSCRGGMTERRDQLPSAHRRSPCPAP
jgi:hypothetical protein